MMTALVESLIGQQREPIEEEAGHVEV